MNETCMSSRATMEGSHSAFSQLISSRHDSLAGASVVAVDPSASAVAVGSSKGLCVYDLDWPWDPSQWLPTAGRVKALEWQHGLGLVLASASGQGMVSVYDLISGNGLASSLMARRTVSTDVSALSWSSTSAHLLAARTAGGCAVVWDVRMGKSEGLVRLECPSAPDSSDGGSGRHEGDMCWAAGVNEHAIVASSGAALRLWDLRRPERPVGQWDAHAGDAVLCVMPTCVAPAGLVSMGMDGVIKLWSTSTTFDADANDPASSAADYSDPHAPPGLRCIASAESPTPVHHACGRLPLADEAHEALTPLVMTICDAPSNEPVPKGPSGEPPRGLQAWFVRPCGASTSGDVSVELTHSRWLSANGVHRLARRAAVAGAAEAVEAVRAATADGDEADNVLARTHALAVVSVGTDSRLRLWAELPTPPPPPPRAQEVSTRHLPASSNIDRAPAGRGASTASSDGDGLAAGVGGVAELSALWAARHPTHAPWLRVAALYPTSLTLECALRLPVNDHDDDEEEEGNHTSATEEPPASTTSVADADTADTPGALSGAPVGATHIACVQLHLPQHNDESPTATSQLLSSPTAAALPPPTGTHQAMLLAEIETALLAHGCHMPEPSETRHQNDSEQPSADDSGDAVARAAAPLSPPPAYLMLLMDAVLLAAQRAVASADMIRWRDTSSERRADTPRDSGGRLDDEPGGEGGAYGGRLPASAVGGRLELVPQSTSTYLERPSSTPPPRTCGCRFNASGVLVTFHHSPSPYASMAEAETPRSYADFLSLVQGWQLAPIVRLQRAMGGGSLDAALWDAPSVLSHDPLHDPFHDPLHDPLVEPVEILDEDDDVASSLGLGRSNASVLHSPSLHAHRRRVADGSGTRGGTRRGGPRAVSRGIGDAARGIIGISDGVASAEMDPALAALYLLAPRRRVAAEGDLHSAICMHNAQAALQRGRPDLWRVWSVAASATRAGEPGPSPRRAAGVAYPLASPLLAALLAERLKQRDVQTVAILSCLAAPYAILAPRPRSTDRANSTRGVHPALAGLKSLSAAPHVSAAAGPPSASALEASLQACRNVYADVLRRWGLIVPLAELTKFGGVADGSAKANPPTASRFGSDPTASALALGVIGLDVVSSGVARPVDRLARRALLHLPRGAPSHAAGPPLPTPTLTRAYGDDRGATAAARLGAPPSGSSPTLNIRACASRESLMHTSCTSLFGQLAHGPTQSPAMARASPRKSDVPPPSPPLNIRACASRESLVHGCWYAGAAPAALATSSAGGDSREASVYAGVLMHAPTRSSFSSDTREMSTHAGIGTQAGWNTPREPSMHAGASTHAAIGLAPPKPTTSRQSNWAVDSGRGSTSHRPERAARCAVCRLPVRGLSWHCGTCGHGGHHACMKRWMASAELLRGGPAGEECGHCPAACGCSCLDPIAIGSTTIEPSCQPVKAPAAVDAPPPAPSATGHDGLHGGTPASCGLACFGPQASSAVVPEGEVMHVTLDAALDDRPLPVPLALSEAAEAYRKAYGAFRKGNARGAKGEVSSEALAASTASKHTHRRTSSGGNSPINSLRRNALPGALGSEPPTDAAPPQEGFDLLAGLRSSLPILQRGWQKLGGAAPS